MSHSLPGYGDRCLCGSYYGCHCPPEPDVDGYLDASYVAGFDACAADGYDDRPLAEYIYKTYHRVRWSTAERRLVYAMTDERFAEFTWRHAHRDGVAYAWWFGREHGHDLSEYLAGYDDCGAGLPCAVREPEQHRLYAEALDALADEPDLYDEPLGPWPSSAEVEDWLPF